MSKPEPTLSLQLWNENDGGQLRSVGCHSNAVITLPLREDQEEVTVIFAGENCQSAAGKAVCFPGWTGGIKEGKVRLASSDKHEGMKHYFLFLHGAGQSLLTRSNYKHFCTHLCKSWVPSSKTS